MSLEQIARDMREGTFPAKSPATLREELLKRAERVINDGENITYPSRMAAQHIRMLMCDLADALRAAPLPPLKESPESSSQTPEDRPTLQEAARRLVDELLSQNIARDKFFIGIGLSELHAYTQLPRVDFRADIIGGWSVVWHFNVGPIEASTIPPALREGGQ